MTDPHPNENETFSPGLNLVEKFLQEMRVARSKRQLASHVSKSRIKAGLSVEDMAKELCVDPEDIRRLESPAVPANDRDLQTIRKLRPYLMRKFATPTDPWIKP